ncbi:NAD-dependent succinate-semialdehyde dehydrogenase [Candidatus Woesearchaeota archaeon]|nr:NAD-dependent succinate-semialdehyde dehydrogenase [Candidatus Woesearchaeota archaeon]
MIIKKINPTTEQIIKTYRCDTDKEIKNKVDSSKKAFLEWSKLSIKERCNYLKRIANVLRKRKYKFGEIITREMGKPIKESIPEVEKCAWVCDYYAENGEKFLNDEIVKTENKKSFVTFQPLGVIGCIMPWNFPLWQLFRFGVPALTVGNTVILKHSSIVPGCALAIEDAFKDAGFPKNIFQTVIGHGKIAEKFIPLVDGVSLTGSVGAGIQVAQICSKHLKKVVLELGGSDPFIVLKDANLKQACEGAIRARFINTGQSCIAAKRFIIVKEMFDVFKEKVVELVKGLKVGNPFDKNTDIGPLANEQQLNLLLDQLKRGINEGAEILFGGSGRLNRKGYYFEPTVLSVKRGSVVFKEETFGPLLAILKVNNEDEAVEEANNTEFGLAASVWTKDRKKGEEIARKIQSGFVSINSPAKSDPRLPFGGIKKSGIGRELSRYGLLEFCNIKSIIIN